MTRYKSEQTTYNSLKKKYVPPWKLDRFRKITV